MIICSTTDLARYKGLSTNLDTAIDWLLAGKHLEQKGDGEVIIDGKNIFAGYNTYIPKPLDGPDFETHQDHIDIQMIIRGKEYVQVRDRDGMEVSVPYTPDIEFQHVPSDGSYHTCLLVPGTALILFPEDAHRPSLRTDEETTECFKVVVKVRV